MLTNNVFVYNVFNLLNIRCLYYKNSLLTYYNFKNNTVQIDHIYNTRYETNINLYHKQFGIKSAISIAMRLCRILKINICNFKNAKDLKLYLKNVDLLHK